MTEENEANEEVTTKSSREKKDSSKSISDSVINRSTIKVETHHHHYDSSPELESEPKIKLENTVFYIVSESLPNAYFQNHLL